MTRSSAKTIPNDCNGTKSTVEGLWAIPNPNGTLDSNALGASQTKTIKIQNALKFRVQCSDTQTSQIDNEKMQAIATTGQQIGHDKFVVRCVP